MKKLEISLPRNERDDELVRDIKDATQLFLNELMSKRLQNTLKIKINVRKTTVKKGWGKDCGGVHLADPMGSKPNKEHKILIHYGTNIMSTLAHELVHVYQIATKKYQQRFWKSDGQLHVRWNGKELGLKEKIPYRQRPWEIEAFDLQDKLHSKWKSKLINQMYLISKQQAEQSA